MLDSMVAGINQYFPAKHGLYYLARGDQRNPFAREVRFVNFATGIHETLVSLEARMISGLSVSPDGKTILSSGTRPSAGDDLMLIRNFR